MLTLVYDSKNGFVLPDSRWEPFIEGIITQYNASDKDMTVTVGSSIAFDIMTLYIGKHAIYHKHVQFIDLGLSPNIITEWDYIPVDKDGYAMKHTTIGQILQKVLMDLL